MINWEVNQETGKAMPAGRQEIKKGIFKDILKGTFKILKIKEANISIAIVSGEDIKKANKKYRGKNEVTDVLSFVYEKNPLEGEILICYNKISEQAKEKGHSFEQELKTLLVHSLVHLAGYDHKKESEAKKMMRIEKEILSVIARS